MNLEQLVPPLALCRLIPKGEFKNTYFSYSWCSFRNEYIICKTEWKHQQDSYPAPTLQEIYKTKEYRYIYEKPMDIEGALKVWLERKGIENA